MTGEAHGAVEIQGGVSMGLRIRCNVPAQRAIFNLQQSQKSLNTSLERLSTGLRINRASDDPAGLIISSQLRVQINALEQSQRNSQDASNLIATADAALAEVQNLLSGIKDSIVFAQNTGGATEEQIQAEQDSVDNAIAAIDRIADTTRFADRDLLNGNAEYTTVATVPSSVENLVVRSATFAGDQDTRSIDIDVDTAAERGEITISSAATTGSTTLRITGEYGTEDINLASGAAVADITDAINGVAEFTGVYAETSGSDVVTRTGEFGEEALLQLEVISGTLTGIGAAGSKTSDRGVDAEVSFEGEQFTGNGNTFSVQNRIASLEFNLASGTTAGTNITFSVRDTGLSFQLNAEPRQTDQLNAGISGVGAARLGVAEFLDQIKTAATGTTTNSGGFLNSLATGGDNDLTNDPENASFIVDAAVQQVGRLRGYLGAIQAQNIEPNIAHVAEQIIQLSSSLSTIEDVDFAEEAANLTSQQILQQAGISVLNAANTSAEGVLGLLVNVG
jgi:flagellin